MINYCVLDWNESNPTLIPAETSQEALPGVVEVDIGPVEDDATLEETAWYVVRILRTLANMIEVDPALISAKGYSDAYDALMLSDTEIFPEDEANRSDDFLDK